MLNQILKQRPLFSTKDKAKVELYIDINSYNLNGFELAGVGFTLDNSEITKSYDLKIWGKVNSYYFNEIKQKFEEIRICIDINNDPLAERGIVGGGVFETNSFLETEICVDFSVQESIIKELQSGSINNKKIILKGFALSKKVFRVCWFRISNSAN